MMRFLILALFAFFVGCGDDAAPEDVRTLADVEAECSERNSEMKIIWGCHVCDIRSNAEGPCFDAPYDNDRHYLRVEESEGGYGCNVVLVNAPEDRFAQNPELEAIRAEICE